MLKELAVWVVVVLEVYLALGVVFAVAFVFFGVKRIDPAAASGTWGFRVMIFPGSVALWPLLLRRWWLGSSPPEERTPHRHVARRARR